MGATLTSPCPPTLRPCEDADDPGGPIGSTQSEQQPIADMTVNVEAAQAKYFASIAARRAADAASEIFGGYRSPTSIRRASSPVTSTC